MRLVVWLPLLAACTPQPTPVAPTTITQCPTCPECPVTACPEPNCPTCPEPPPPPKPPDWYCHDVERRNMPRSDFCWLSEKWCEASRQDVIKNKVGKPGPCAPEPIAHCFQWSDHLVLDRQYMCARTPENCERRREWATKHRLKKNDQISACGAASNTERYLHEGDPMPALSPELSPDGQP